MRQLLRVLLASRGACATVTARRRAAPTLRPAILLTAMVAMLAVGCARHSLVPKEQAAAIQSRDRALAAHSAVIHEAIRQSGEPGALVFLDAADSLVIVPGTGPADAWARHTASTAGDPGGRAAVPAVVSFVSRADVPKGPETLAVAVLEQQLADRHAAESRAQALGTAFETALRDEQQRTEERLAAAMAQVASIQRELSEAIAATRQETQTAVAARADLDKAVNALAQELAADRRFTLQTAQLGWLNHELNVENAGLIRKVAATSQELTSTSARLADTMRQLSESLGRQLTELGERLETIQKNVGAIK